MVKLKELLKYCPEFIYKYGQWVFAILPGTINTGLEWEFNENYLQQGSEAILGKNSEGKIKYIVKQAE